MMRRRKASLRSQETAWVGRRANSSLAGSQESQDSSQQGCAFYNAAKKESKGRLLFSCCVCTKLTCLIGLDSPTAEPAPSCGKKAHCLVHVFAGYHMICVVCQDIFHSPSPDNAASALPVRGSCCHPSVSAEAWKYMLLAAARR